MEADFTRGKKFYVLSTPTGRANDQGVRTGAPAFYIDGDASCSGWDRGLERAHRFETREEAEALRASFIAARQVGSRDHQRKMEIAVQEIED